MPRVELIGRYAVLERHPSTGACDVFLVREAKTDRTLSLKLLKGSAANAADAQRFRRLQRETEALAKNPHPNVLRVYECGLHENRPYLVMDQPSGVTLAEWLDEEKRTWSEVLEKFVEAGRGLGAAHSVSVLHRDFKPENVLVTAAGEVHVIDFGLTGFQEETPAAVVGDKLTPEELELKLARQAAAARGPAYAAPEQRSRIPAGPAADQYSFCFALKAALAKVDKPEKLLEQNLNKVLERGLSTAPIARYPKMESLLAALARASRVPLYRKHPRAILGAAGGAVVVVLAIVGIAAKVSSSSHTDSCGLGQLEPLWPAKRAKLIDSLPKIAPERETIATVLDDYAARWRDEQNAYCDAAEDVKENNLVEQQKLERQATCLNRRLQAFGALLTAAEDPSLKNPPGLARAARALPSPTECKDPKVLSTFPEPTPPEKRGETDKVYASLYLGKTWETLGQGERAAKWFGAAVTSAQQLNDKPSLADAYFAQAEFTRPKSATDAEPLYFNALEAAQAGSHDDTAARAALELSKLLPQSRVTESDRWLRLAAALGERGPQGNVWQARIELQRAKLAFAKGDDTRAIQSAQKARGLLPQDAGEGWEALTLLAEMKERGGKNDEACALAAEALKLSQKLYGPESPKTAENMAHRGRCLLQEGKMQEALAALRAATKVAVDARGTQDPAVSRMLVQVGSLELKLGNNNEAVKTLRQSLAGFEKEQNTEDAEYLTAVTEYGNALTAVHRWDEAHSQYQKVVKTAEKAFGPKSVLLGEPLAGIGKVYLALGWYAKALASLQRALKLIPSKESVLRADTQFTLAKGLWATGEKVRPLRLANEAADTLRAAGPSQQDELEKIETWIAKRQPVARR